MNALLFIVIVMKGSFLFFKSFFPIAAKCIKLDHVELNEETIIVDLRDYHLAAKAPIEGAFVLPFAYLKRYHNQFKGKKLYIVSPDTVIRNLSIRFLKGKGYLVLGYCILDCNDKLKQCS